VVTATVIAGRSTSSLAVGLTLRSGSKVMAGSGWVLPEASVLRAVVT
jgi:hypothetical protein